MKEVVRAIAIDIGLVWFGELGGFGEWSSVQVISSPGGSLMRQSARVVQVSWGR